MAWAVGFVNVAKTNLDTGDEADNNLSPGEIQIVPGSEDLDLQRLRQSIGEENAQLSDEFLNKCLRYEYQTGNEAIAAKTAQNFLKYRKDFRWSMRIPTSDVNAVLETGLHWLLWPPAHKPSHLKNGTDYDDDGPAACLVFNMAKLDLKLAPVETYQKLSLFLMEHATDYREVQDRGVAVILDFRGVQFTKFQSMVGMEDIKRGLQCCVGSFPCRLRRIWLLGAPLPIRLLTNAVVHFLSPKVRQRIRLANGQSGVIDMAKDLGPYVQLPEHLGGVGTVDWKSMLEALLKGPVPQSAIRKESLLSL